MNLIASENLHVSRLLVARSLYCFNLEMYMCRIKSNGVLADTNFLMVFKEWVVNKSVRFSLFFFYLYFLKVLVFSDVVMPLASDLL